MISLYSFSVYGQIAYNGRVMKASQKPVFPPEIAELLARGAGFVPLTLDIELDSEDGAALAMAFLRHLNKPGRDLAFFRRSKQNSQSVFVPAESLIACDAFESLNSMHGKTLLQNGGKTEVVPGDAFAVLSERLQRYAVPPSSATPAFCGSAVGYFAYDAVRHLEKRLQSSEGNLNAQFDAQSTESDAEFRFFRNFFVFDHVGKTLSIVSGFVSDQATNAERFAEAKAELGRMQDLFLIFRDQCRLPLPKIFSDAPEVPFESFLPSLGKTAFFNGVQKLLGDIRQGEIFQAVLSEKLSAPFEGEPLKLFEILTAMSPSPYDFFVALGSKILLGSSPEMLLKVERQSLESHPIAGTRPRGKTQAEDLALAEELLANVKEKSEHLMLVDLARNDVGRVSEAGSVRVDNFMEIQRFSSVMHLVSRVKGRLKRGVTAVQALAASFPAGTLSGAPKVRAMQILSGLEKERRGFYGGAVVSAGYNGDLDSCIAIRSAKIEAGRIFIQAGAGIVADSTPEGEYEEVQHKTRTLRRALGQHRQAAKT